MKKISVIVLSTILMATMLLGTNVFAASSRRETITLANNSEWKVCGSVVRSGSYYTLEAKCYAVYPTDNSMDLFNKIKTQAVTPYQSPITDVYILSETSAATTMTIKDGMLGFSSIHFRFCGNDPNYSAYADVYYDAK